jgi:Zn-dependent peptidase ImmA (M78 family)
MADWNKCRQKAEEVLKKYGINKPLIDVFDIAQSEGIQIVYFQPQNSTDEDISGFFYKDADTKIKKIYINKLDSAPRQVYTVAHELGHYFLGHKPNEYSVLLRQAVYAAKKDDAEKEADKFAAELLMPKKMIETIKREYKLTNNDELILSQLFGVSQKAMHNRLDSLSRYK